MNRTHMNFSPSSNFHNLSTHQLVLLITALAAALAAQIGYIQQGWVNNDSILYFEAARLFAQGEWNTGFKLFPWPLYSGLIALTHKITGFSLYFSAQLLNVIFFTITTASFLKLIEISGGNKNTLLAGGLILFSSQYVVGDVMQMLMRDQGFWAFFLTALYFFIRFYMHGRFKDALFWQFSILIAMLFRIEAITFLLLLPMTLLLRSGVPLKTRLGSLTRAYLLNLISALLLGLVVLLYKDFSVDQLGRLREILTLDLYTELTKNLLQKSEVMASQVLGGYLDEFAIEGILLTFLFVMISKTISATGLINFGMAIFAFKQRKNLFNTEAWQVMRVAMLIAALNMFLIITKVFVLSGRYVVALAFMLMILAAFFLANSFKYYGRTGSDKSKKLILTIVLIVLSLSLIKNILPKRDGYNYEQDAIAWLALENPQMNSVFFDDARLRYYANAPYVGRWSENWRQVEEAIEEQRIHTYQYLVISHNEDHPEVEINMREQLPEYQEVHRSFNTRGKKSVAIYKRITDSPNNAQSNFESTTQ